MPTQGTAVKFAISSPDGTPIANVSYEDYLVIQAYADSKRVTLAVKAIVR